MRIRHLLFSVTASILLSSAIFAQAGSVELKSGTGTLISSHASVTEAYAAIVTPMTQGYIIELAASYTGASETFPILISQKDGIDSTKRITIRPATGVTLVTIASLQASLPIFLFDGGDFVTIDGRAGGAGSSINLFIENTTTSGASTTTINFINGATYNELRYIHAKNSLQNSAGPRVIQFATSANNPEGNSYNKVTNVNWRVAEPELLPAELLPIPTDIFLFRITRSLTGDTRAYGCSLPAQALKLRTT